MLPALKYTHSVWKMECLSPPSSLLLPLPHFFCWLWAPRLKDLLSFPSGAAGAATVGQPSIFSHPLNKAALGDGKVAWWLRTLTALPEVPGLIPSTHLVAHDHF